jgi:beta-glucosidase
VIDIARDPRWGRTEETFGEDPYLTSVMGAAYIRGLQGEDWTEGVMATAKHFVGYSASEGGLNWAPAHITPRELREVYLAPFETAVRAAKLATIMPAYHEIDGEPCSSSHWLMTEVLRNEWGFDGLVVSDYMAINQLRNYHLLARDKADAARLALEAGMDLELPSIDAYGQALIDAVKAGEIALALIDRSVRRMLALKFAFGLFEHPYIDPDAVLAVFDTQAQRGLAREIARKSMVLLKNEGNLLPLSKSLSSVAIIGPNADETRNLLGDYSYPAHIETLIVLHGMGFSEQPLPASIKLVDDYADMISPLTAIHGAVSAQTQVYYAKGCDVNSDSTAGFAAAIDAARKAEVAIVIVGDKAGLTPECTSGEFRDSAHLTLPGVQQALVEASAGDRYAGRARAGDRTPLRHPVAGGRGAGGRAGVAAWRRRRARVGRSDLRRREPQRQAADHLSAPRRPGADLLRSPTIGRQVLLLRPVHRREQRAALPLRFRAELHQFRL